MIFTWATPEELLLRVGTEAHLSSVRVILFFLGTKYDGDFLADVRKLSKELDTLTGRHCLAVAFVPPPPHARMLDMAYSAGGKTWSRDDWEGFQSAMLQTTYQLADQFGVDYASLPCLLFLNPNSASQTALLQLRSNPLPELIPKLRALFSEWHREHLKELDDLSYYLALTETGSFTKGLAQPIRERIHALVRERVLTDFGPVVLGAVKAMSGDLPKAERIVKRLIKKPEEFNGIEDFFNQSGLEVEFRGKVASSQNVASVLRNEYEAAIDRQAANEELARLKNCIPDFPFDRVKRIDGNARIYDLVNRFAPQVTLKKIEIEPWAFLKQLFGFGSTRK